MKAVTLVSGGLDSTLATKLVCNLGIELVALNTVTPFCLCNRRLSSLSSCGAASIAKELNLRLISLNVSDEFLEIVKKPKHGYGSNMNPCIDCRILLFKKAKEVMFRENASFVITGEVLGQRPMSQRLNTMLLIEKESGLEGLVVRPLSAKVLEQTIPEQKGWIDRSKLLTICGRGRKMQIALAKDLGINDYPCPSGGCLLTDPGFSKRLKDLMRHGGLNLEGIQLLKIGRHFRLNDMAKLIVGRDEKENERLINFAKNDDLLFMPLKIAGPTGLAKNVFDHDLIELCCSIISWYSDLNGCIEAEIAYRRTSEKEDKILRALPIEENRLTGYRL